MVNPYEDAEWLGEDGGPVRETTIEALRYQHSTWGMAWLIKLNASSLRASAITRGPTALEQHLPGKCGKV